MLDKLRWLGHASFLIEGSQVVYMDPWKLGEGLPAADLILVTHGHRDHLSPMDIAKISGPNTVVVVAASCAGDLAKHFSGDVWTVSPGESITVGDVSVEAVLSYNTDKPNHPRSAGNVGYVAKVDGVRYYHAGDTDVIDEMAEVRCDVALLPMGGTYTMDAQEAAKAAAMIKPRYVVPMHWGDIVGSAEDVERMRSLMPEGVELAVLTPER